ncbi:MAG TPA: hypothetical protein VGS80_05095, partial [Ktedonobacterales bacterium]|nr:hypothetical protein [Ktedonobacterales bacterium]
VQPAGACASGAKQKALVAVTIQKPTTFLTIFESAMGVFCLAGLLLLLLLLLLLFLLLRRARRVPGALGRRGRREPGAQAAAPQAAALGSHAIAALNQRITRLEELRSWMGEDPELGRLIDATIGAQMRAAEQRQRLFSGLIAVASLVAGWVLSTISLPAILYGFLHH